MSDSNSNFLKSSLDAEGRRKKVRISDVSGKFTNYRRIGFFLLILIYAIIPLFKIGGRPLIFIDILNRKFFLFGQTFNSQDFYLVFFLITGVAFLLFYITALIGRVWCGWACPQTVFLEGVYRRIERWVEGTKSEQLLLEKSNWNFHKVSKFILKHFLYIIVTLLVTHIFLSYFVSLDQLLIFITSNPHEHWEAFLWMISMSVILYINFTWFREQLCLIVCPYGRIQSVLTDDDTLVIGYDEYRGETRGKLKDPQRGDCIDCKRCVEVCPTSIDIRNGLQLECIGCANCIDACDEIMEKIGQSKGLIRYDSLNGLYHKSKKIIRPRIIAYTFFLILGVVVFSVFLSLRKPFEANILRASGAPYQITDHKVRNTYQIHLINKTNTSSRFKIEPLLDDSFHYILPFKEITLDSLEGKYIPLFVEQRREKFSHDQSIQVQFENLNSNEVVISEVKFLGPTK